MSALTPSRPRLRGVTWVVVHQHRRLLITAAALAAIAAVVSSGLRIAYELTAYDARATGLFTRNAYQGGMAAVADFLANAAFLLPLLVAAVVAGPLVARELEGGTHRLVWSQSVPPARWFAAKIAVPAVATAVLAAGLTVVFRTLWGPVAWDWRLSWYSRQVFLTLGPTLLAHCLLAVAVGALTGLLVRRTMVAMPVAGLATGSVVGGAALLWGELWPTRTETLMNLDRTPGHDRFTTDRGLLNADGERLSGNLCLEPGYEACVARHDVVGRYWEYHPMSHLWPLQLVETGVVLALAALVTYTALRVFRRRHA